MEETTTADVQQDGVSEPAPKKLRFAEPDLLIVLKYPPPKEEEEENDEEEDEEEDDDDHGDDEEEEEEESIDNISGAASRDTTDERVVEDDESQIHDDNNNDDGSGGAHGGTKKKNDDNNKEEKEEDGAEMLLLSKEYRMYSQVLAKYSKFIDTSLSVGMKEKETSTIVFRDVLPDVFEKAISYLEDPGAARDVSAQDILEVINFYDQYEFTSGLQFGDKILTEYFDTESGSTEPPEDLDFLLNAVCAAYQLGLEKSMKAGFACINSITQPQWGKEANPCMLSPQHVELIQHLFVGKNISLPQKVAEGGLSDEELASPLFPKYFYKCVTEYSCCSPKSLSIKFENFDSTTNVFRKYHGGTIRLPGPRNDAGRLPSVRPRGPNFWKVFPPTAMTLDDDWKVLIVVERIKRIGGDDDTHDENWLSAEQKDGDWAIFVYEDPNTYDGPVDPPHPAFWAPYSSHLEFPPVKPWKATDTGTASSLGAPTLSYKS